MNQKQVRILIGAIFILILGGFVFYFQNDIQKFVNRKNADKTVENKNNGPNVPTPYPRAVRGAMFVDGYKMSIENEADIISAFEEMKIFGRSYVTDGKQTTGRKPLELIAIAIRNETPPDGRKPTYGEFTYINFAEGAIQANFVLNNSQLNDPNIGETLVRELLGAVYKAVYSTATEDQVDAEAEKAYGNLIKKNSEYIKIGQI